MQVTFAAPAKFVYANPQVRADSGKTAIVRGPLVYCLEEIDNGENLPAIFVDTDVSLTEEPSNLFGGIVTVKAKGKEDRRVIRLRQSLRRRKARASGCRSDADSVSVLEQPGRG